MERKEKEKAIDVLDSMTKTQSMKPRSWNLEGITQISWPTAKRIRYTHWGWIGTINCTVFISDYVLNLWTQQPYIYGGRFFTFPLPHISCQYSTSYKWIFLPFIFGYSFSFVMGYNFFFGIWIWTCTCILMEVFG